MTGEPPYASHTPFSAMYRMVEDDHPPLPTGISQSLESFLLLCFQKNVDLRYTAKVLKRHVRRKKEEEEEEIDEEESWRKKKRHNGTRRNTVSVCVTTYFNLLFRPG